MRSPCSINQGGPLVSSPINTKQMTTTKKVILTCLLIDAVVAIVDIAIFDRPLFNKMVDGVKDNAKKAGIIVKNVLKKKKNG